MTIEYYIKSNYGNNMMYVKSDTQRVAITSLTGAKTLTASAKRALEVLGFNFVQVLPE